MKSEIGFKRCVWYGFDYLEIVMFQQQEIHRFLHRPWLLYLKIKYKLTHANSNFRDVWLCYLWTALSQVIWKLSNFWTLSHRVISETIKIHRGDIQMKSSRHEGDCFNIYIRWISSIQWFDSAPVFHLCSSKILFDYIRTLPIWLLSNI